jgi:solute carrier family 35, member F1/2
MEEQHYNIHSKMETDTTPELTMDKSSQPGTAIEISGDSSHTDSPAAEPAAIGTAIHTLEAKDVHWYSYLQTVDFWLVLIVGQVLSLCITGTNTFTSLLANMGWSIPALQTIFNYTLLSIIYVPIMVYMHGFKKIGQIIVHDLWKYFILSFLDVLGNYFTVLAYAYTNLLSAQLLNFWSIVCVVIVSFTLLKVRYKLFQVLGILICCGGMGILLASDHLQGTNGGPGVNLLKGDLFGLLGATLYGISNVFEEWFVSKRPVYEVLSFLGVLGVIINGVVAAIFDRPSFENAPWNGDVAGYLVGYTLVLTIFYSLAPLILRMGSAAFFDISLLTSNFWGTIIGIHVFGYIIHFLYPIAFVLIIAGLAIYFLAGSILGDSKKPWLGANQEDGVAGFGTAKLKALNLARKQGLMATESHTTV